MYLVEYYIFHGKSFFSVLLVHTYIDHLDILPTACKQYTMIPSFPKTKISFLADPDMESDTPAYSSVFKLLQYFARFTWLLKLC